MKTLIHVCAKTIRRNMKDNTNKPIINVIKNNVSTYHHKVDILGPSKVIYEKDNPIVKNDKFPNTGKCWIETESEVITHG